MSAIVTASTVSFWGIVKGVALEAIPVLAILDPPAAAALTTALAIADALVTLLPLLEAGSEQLLASLSALDGHAKSVLIQAAPSINVVPKPLPASS